MESSKDKEKRPDANQESESINDPVNAPTETHAEEHHDEIDEHVLQETKQENPQNEPKEMKEESPIAASPQGQAVDNNADEEVHKAASPNTIARKKYTTGLRSRKIRILIILILLTAILVAVIVILITQIRLLDQKKVSQIEDATGDSMKTTDRPNTFFTDTATNPASNGTDYGLRSSGLLKQSAQSPFSPPTIRNSDNVGENETLYRDYGSMFFNPEIYQKNFTAQNSTPPNNLIIISLDGFSPKYLEFHRESTIKYLGSSGSMAEGMIPVFPTVTFPNHYSMVTGVLPAYHGIIGQVFHDGAEEFRYKDGSSMDPKWWLADPIWNTIQDHGLKSACCFWPGSSTAIKGRTPTYNLPYDESMGNLDRIYKLLEWLDIPEESGQHPYLYCSYMSIIDKKGQKFGPYDDSAELIGAIEEVNAVIAVLVEEIAKRNLTHKTNILIVSDHGMAPVDSFGGAIVLPKYVNQTMVLSIEIAGAMAFIIPKPEYENDVARQLELASYMSGGNFLVYRKGNFPAEFHFDIPTYTVENRVPPIIALCNPGYIFTRSYPSNFTIDRGAHGYSPLYSDMDALFVSIGPDIRKNVDLGRFSILDLYNLLCSILKVPPLPNNGTSYLVDRLLNT